MDPRAYGRYPSSSSISRPVVTKCNLLDKVISGRSEVSQFCKCGNCCMQGTVRESFCCLETGDSLSPYAANVSKVIAEHRCICDVPRIRAIVLGSEDLELFHQHSVYLKQLGGLPVCNKVSPSDPQRYLRFAAYSKLTLHFHGTLGMSNRIELPSCLVKFIRQQYPSKSGDYTGFRDAFYDE
uniref:P2X purinoreceptor 7 intracellular domain-containing protein n=1 Tax=Panagrolaimus davidi TaxID=227884 RepID=A0A914PCR6_9BILA